MELKNIYNKNKGFSLVELLATITIIGILTSVAIVGVSKYTSKAKDDSFKYLQEAIFNASEEYVMDHKWNLVLPSKPIIEIYTLYDEGYIENIKSPYDKDEDCTGKVEVTKDDGNNTNVSRMKYQLNITCSDKTSKEEFTN